MCACVCMLVDKIFWEQSCLEPRRVLQHRRSSLAFSSSPAFVSLHLAVQRSLPKAYIEECLSPYLFAIHLHLRHSVTYTQHTVPVPQTLLMLLSYGNIFQFYPLGCSLDISVTCLFVCCLYPIIRGPWLHGRVYVLSRKIQVCCPHGFPLLGLFAFIQRTVAIYLKVTICTGVLCSRTFPKVTGWGVLLLM